MMALKSFRLSSFLVDGVCRKVEANAVTLSPKDGLSWKMRGGPCTPYYACMPTELRCSLLLKPLPHEHLMTS